MMKLGAMLFLVGVLLFIIAKFIMSPKVNAAGKRMQNYAEQQRKREGMSRIQWEIMYDRIAYEDELGIRDVKKGMQISRIQLVLISISLFCIVGGLYLINHQ